MSDKQLKTSLNSLFDELCKSDNRKQDKLILAKAVQLGMTYQEELIREGIDIVFAELHKHA